MKFELDPANSASNKVKRGLDFVEAQAVWKSVRVEIPAKMTGGQFRYAVLGKIGSTQYTVIVSFLEPPCESSVRAVLQKRRNESMKNKSAKSKPGTGISVEEFDRKASDGDISQHLDLSQARVFAPGEARLDLTPTKVNVDFPKWMVESLDSASDRLGVPRQSLIKMWLAERLEHSL